MNKGKRKLKQPNTRNAGTMTEAEYFQQIRYALRKQFRWWKPMIQALKNAERPSQSKNKRLKYEYQCAVCKNWYPRTGVQIDHKIPCGQLNKYEDIAPFIKSLTKEGTDSYQILCKKHHLVKTRKEKEERKLAKTINNGKRSTGSNRKHEKNNKRNPGQGKGFSKKVLD